MFKTNKYIQFLFSSFTTTVGITTHLIKVCLLKCMEIYLYSFILLLYAVAEGEYYEIQSRLSGQLLIALVDADGHGWIVGRTYNLWVHGTSLDVNQHYILRWKHCARRWIICFNTRHARTLEQTVRS